MATLAQFTELKLLVPRLLSDHRESVVAELGERLENAGRVENAEAFSRAVLEHDELVSAVFDGVAFPLARSGIVKKLSFAVGLEIQPIRWGKPPAPLVHTIMLFAVPVSEENRYPSLVLASSKFLKDGTTLSALRSCVQPEEMLEIFNQIRI